MIHKQRDSIKEEETLFFAGGGSTRPQQMKKKDVNVVQVEKLSTKNNSVTAEDNKLSDKAKAQETHY